MYVLDILQIYKKETISGMIRIVMSKGLAKLGDIVTRDLSPRFFPV